MVGGGGGRLLKGHLFNIFRLLGGGGALIRSGALI